MANEVWSDTFSHMFVNVLPTKSSNHCPPLLFLKGNETTKNRSKIFLFEASWALLDEYKNIV